jgi:hypothetical protein
MSTVAALSMVPRTNAHEHLQPDLLRERHELADVATAREVKLAAFLLVVNPEDVPASTQHAVGQMATQDEQANGKELTGAGTRRPCSNRLPSFA